MYTQVAGDMRPLGLHCAITCIAQLHSIVKLQGKGDAERLSRASCLAF